MKRSIKLIQLAALCCAASAHAYPSVSGQVGMLEIVGGGAGAPGNYDLRVFLQGYPVQCNGQNWSYVNVTDANYKGLLAGLLSAKATSSPVVLYINQDSGGFCQLMYMTY